MERYEKVRVIGQGAFGKVFLCRRKVDNVLLVIKQIPVDELQKEERKASLNEVEVLSRLKHPNIIAYFDNFMEEKSLMIVMEYAPGGTLFDFIQDRNGVLLEEEHILQFFVQLVVAIEHVHSLNILHRDLKTQNIMLNKKRTVVKMGDFGISKVLSSKITSAQTVVGTPCYISPEICEGRMYAKKSDIWALGCILYELTMLKKAFEGPNLPALVLKIMQASASLSPIDTLYSKGLRDFIHSLLQRNPDDRPNIENIMATPVVVNALMNLCTDIGRLPCSRVSQSAPEAPKSGKTHTDGGRGAQAIGSRSGSLKKCRQRSFFEDDYRPPGDESGIKIQRRPQVYFWGGGQLVPTILPAMADSRIVSVAAGRSQRAGVTDEGKLVFWELFSGSLSTMRFTMQQTQAKKKDPLVFVPRLVGGLSTAVIKKVACGDMFTACLTDKGILMTFGSGVNGCLGHGDFNDVAEPRLVHHMLAYETTEVACGANHVIAITTDNMVFAWGKGDSGQLGLGNHSSHATPQPVSLPDSYVPKTACCGADCSLLITERGRVLAAGCNRYNKLCLDGEATKIDPKGAISPKPEQSPPSITSYKSETHSDRLTQQKEATPGILSLIKDPPSLGSSLIFSSLHARGKTDSRGMAGSGQRRSSAQMEHLAGTVDEALTFQPCKYGEKRIAAASTGTNHTAFLTDSGECITCGDNSYGQLGCYRKTEGRCSPAVVAAGLSGREVERVACGDFFTLASTKAGDVYSWGRGRRGRLGRETEEDIFEPQPVTFENPHTIQSIACSHGVTLLLSAHKS